MFPALYNRGSTWIPEPPAIPRSNRSGETRYTVLGLDLGQSQDPSAMVIGERREYRPDFEGPPDFHVRVRTIFQWPLGTDYTQVVSDVLSEGADVTVVEYNGVGRPVVDMMRKEAQRRNYRGLIRPVVTASSDSRLRAKGLNDGFHLVVPKPDLLSSIELLRMDKSALEKRANDPDVTSRLVLPNVPEVQQLLQQIGQFQAKYTSRGNVQLGGPARDGHHFDLVIALGLMCFWFVRMRKFNIAV